MKVYSYDISQLQVLANEVKEVVLGMLEHEGIIAKGQATSLAQELIILTAEKGMLGKAIDLLLHHTEKTFYITGAKWVGKP